MPDAAASTDNHLLVRIDERVKGLDKKVDRFITHQEVQDIRIGANKDAITEHRVRLDNVTKVFGLIQLGFVAVVAWFKSGS